MNQTTSDQSAAQSPAPDTSKPRRKWLRRIIWTAAILLVLLVLLAAMAPTLLSTSAGRGFIVGQINARIPGKVAIGDLSLSWLGGQTVSDLRLVDPQGAPVTDIARVELPDYSLLKAVRGSMNLGQVTIVHRSTDLVRQADGTLNLMQALSKPGASPAPTTPPPTASAPATFPTDLRAALSFTGGKLSIRNVGQEAVVLNDPNLQVKLLQPGVLEADLAAMIDEGARSGGKIKLTAAAKDWLDASQDTLTVDKLSMQVQSDLDQLPVALLDQVMGTAGQRKWATTLGPTIKGQVQAQIAQQQVKSVVIDLTGQNLSVQANLQNQQGTLIAQTPATVRANVTPESWKLWTGGSGSQAAMTLRKPFELQLKIASLSLPMEGFQPKLNQAAMQLTASSTDIELSGGETTGTNNPALSSVALRKIQAQAELAGAKNTVSMQLTADAEQAGRSAPIKVGAQVANLWDAKGQLAIDQVQLDAQASAPALPVALVDQLAGTGQVLASTLGTSLAREMKARLQPGQANGMPDGRIELSGQSEYLTKLQVTGQVKQGRLTLDPNGQVNLRLTPSATAAILRHYAGNVAALASLEQTDPAQINLTLTKLELPVNSPSLDNLSLSVQVDVDRLAYRGVPTVNRAALAKNRINLNLGEGKSALTYTGDLDVQDGKVRSAVTGSLSQFIQPKGQFDLAGAQGEVKLPGAVIAADFVDQLAKMSNVSPNLVGPSLTANVTAHLVRPAANPQQTYLTAWQADLKSAAMDFKGAGQVSAERLTLAPGTLLNWTISPQGFNSLKAQIPAMAQGLGNIQLAQPIAARLTLGVVEVPLAGEGWKNSSLAANLTLDQLALRGDSRVEGLALSLVALDVPAGTLSGTLKPKLTAQIYSPQAAKSGALTADLSLTNPLGGLKQYQAIITVEQLAMQVVDQLAGQKPGALAGLLGATLNQLRAQVEVGPNQPGINWSLGGQTPQARVQLAGQFLAKERLTLTQPGKVEWTLSPQGFADWQKAVGRTAAQTLVLEQPATFTVDLPKLQVGLGQDGLAWERTFAQAVVSSPILALRSPTRNQAMSLRNVNLSADSTDLRKETRLNLQAQNAGGTGAQTGNIDSKTTILGLVGQNNRIDLSKASFQTDTILTQLPTGILDDLLGAGGKLHDLTGSYANLQAKGSYQPGQGGAMDLTVDSQNLKASMPAMLDGQMNLTLRQDAQVQVRITPELSKSYLSFLSPVFSQVQSSQQPVKLTLSKNSLLVPLQNFDLSKVRADGVLDVGTLRVQRDKDMAALVAALRFFGSTIQDRAEFDARFTPMTFNLKDSVLQSSDLWIDTGDMLMGSQARVYLNGRGETKTTYGELLYAIPGQTLRLIPQVGNRIPMNALYTAGSVGPLNAMPGVDFTKVITGIVGPIVGSSTGRSEIGALIGLGANIVSGISSSNQPQGGSPSWWSSVTWANRPKPPAEPAPAPAPAAPTPAPKTPAVIPAPTTPVPKTSTPAPTPALTTPAAPTPPTSPTKIAPQPVAPTPATPQPAVKPESTPKAQPAPSEPVNPLLKLLEERKKREEERRKQQQPPPQTQPQPTKK